MKVSNIVVDWLECIWQADLPSSSKLVAAYLRKYMNSQRDFTWVGVERISRETGLSANTVRSHLKNLEQNGWLAIQYTKGGQRQTNVYRIVLPPLMVSNTDSYPPTDEGLPEDAQPLSLVDTLQPLRNTPQLLSDTPQPVKGNKQVTKQVSNQSILNNNISDENERLALNYWTKKGLVSEIDLEEQWLKFTAHHTQRDTKIRDYNAAWRTWYVNAVTYYKPRAKKKSDPMQRLVDNSWANGIDITK